MRGGGGFFSTETDNNCEVMIVHTSIRAETNIIFHYSNNWHAKRTNIRILELLLLNDYKLPFQC